MKIYYSPSSPFVRKVMVVAQELGVEERIERLKSAVHPIRHDVEIVGHNPLGQVPTFFTDDGEVLYDSAVICEYLDTTYGNGEFFPADPAIRWRALRDQALGDGMTNACLLIRYELTVREVAMQNSDWITGQRRKVEDGTRLLEATIADWQGRFDIGTLAFACALSYMDFRLPEIAWREKCPNTACWLDQLLQRPSLQQTWPSLPS